LSSRLTCYISPLPLHPNADHLFHQTTLSILACNRSVIADRIYPQNGCKRVAGLFCHAQQNRLTVLERPKAMGIGPTWSARCKSPPLWPRITPGGDRAVQGH